MAPPPLSVRLEDAKARLRTVPERVRTAATVANQSGLLWNFSGRGALAAARALATGAQNPSTIHRIHAANTPDRAAVIWRDRTLTFRELDDRMDRAGTGLKRRGIGRGKSVILMMKNRPEFLELQGGATRVGAAAVSVSWRSTAAELVYLATNCGAEMIAFEADVWPAVEEALRSLPNLSRKNLVSVGGSVGAGTSAYEELLPERGVHEDAGSEDAAVVIYTSGTTGKPKGAVRRFSKDAIAATLRFIAETPMRADDVHLVTCPLYHSTAFGFTVLTHLLGGTVVVMDEFKPESFLSMIERYRVTTTAMVPTMLYRVVALGPDAVEAANTRSLREIMCGGAPLSGPLATEAMDLLGDIVFNFYGATETGLVTLAKPADLRAAPGTIGRAVPGNDIRLLGEDGREVAAGEVGELYVKNDMLVAGYHGNDEATRESMREGYFSVGDLARKDRDGRYFIEGRKRDMIISGGVNVYPAEVEGVLEGHPAIGEVAVVGVPDAEWGERVRAFVALRERAELDEAALKLWVRERLAGAKVPRDFVFMERLPRNPTGKVLKRELRDWCPER